MKVNSFEVIDRHNRPGVLQRVVLRAFFLNDGSFQDPVEISAVTIVPKKNEVVADEILASDGLIASSVNPEVLLMNFANNSADTTDSSFDPTNYTPGSSASGIYRLSEGEYAVILDGGLSPDLSGVYNLNGSSLVIENTADTANVNYHDIWTIKQVASSKLKTVFHSFRLHDDTFFSVTQPLLLKPRNRLTTKHIQLGSKIDLKVTTEISIENKDIDASLKNIFKESAITEASLEITKINEDVNLPSRVTVSGFDDTTADVDITSDNTLVFSWDTDALKNHAKVASGDLGSLSGPYTVQVKYTLLNQTILSPLFNLVLS